MGLFDFLTSTLAIDAGSQNLRIYENYKQLIFDEPSRILIEIKHKKNKIAGVGNDNVTVKHEIIYPIHYIVDDFIMFEYLLRKATQKGLQQKTTWIGKSYKMFITYPTSASLVNLRVVTDSAEHSGAKEVYLIPAHYATVTGQEILYKKDFSVIDFGASKVEISIFADDEVITTKMIRFGTWKLKSVIKNHLFRVHKINATDEDCEKLLQSYNPVYNAQNINIQGKKIQVLEIIELLEVYFIAIEDIILEAFEEINEHPKRAKILENGIHFTGGGSQNEAINYRICGNGKLKFTMSKNPFLDNIRGVAKIMGDPKRHEKYWVT